jgi:hypothetical protein
VFDVDNDWRLRLLPLPVVGVIRSGEELPDAPPWSTVVPRDESDGHEWQFYDPAPGELKEEEVQDLIRLRVQESSVAPELRPALLQVIMDRRRAFLTKGCPIRPLVGASHDIEVSGRPFKEQPFQVSPLQREVLEKETKSMLKVGVIRPSKSPWSSRLLVVKKPDGSWRP